MKRFIFVLATAGFILAGGFSIADEHEEEAPDSAVPVEIYACKYNEGMGAAELDAATAKWNTWADGRELHDYTAWTLTKWYSGPEQDFDFLWLGVSPTAQALGAAQDDWLATGGEVAAEFERVATCDGHGNFAAINFKQPPDREEPPDNIVISFSDCTIAEGKNFVDVAPAITAWAEFRTAQGSESGHWVLFPAYGGGGEKFDFKYVTGHLNHEAQGIDYDNYDPDKFRELFTDLLDCDSSRVYNAANRRRAADME